MSEPDRGCGYVVARLAAVPAGLPAPVPSPVSPEYMDWKVTT